MSSGEKEEKRISRRDFVRGAAVSAAAVAGAGILAGCKNETPAPTASTETQECPPCPTAAPCPPCADSWRPEKWDKETDVVVVGAGYAGLCAAIEAKAAGAEVLVLEKNDFPGGNGILCAGNTILGATHVQNRVGIEDHEEWWYEDQMAWGEYRAVPELMRLYTQKGGELALWLEQLGLVWRDQLRASDDARVPRGHGPAESPNYPGSKGISQITVLLNELERLEAPILLQHKMKRIYREPNGPVLGVEVETEDGNINIKARKAVVLGSGGFKSNVQMRTAWDPRLDADLGAGGLPFVETTGEGSMAAVNVGAGFTDMSYVCEFRVRWGTKTYQSWEPPTLTTVPGGAGISAGDYHRLIMVKNDGQRYVNEAGEQSLCHHTFWQAFLNLKEKPRNVWAITDAEGAAELKWPEDEMRDPQPLAGRALYPGCVAVADSIQELASQMGIDPVGLEATVNRYNAFVDAGEDGDFEKPQPLYSISKPPFFAAKMLMLCHDQMGGLRANTKAQVLDRSEQIVAQGVSIDQEKVIPHLYAAGECVGGYVGAERGHGKIGVYMIWGRIAGQNAAQETRLS